MTKMQLPSDLRQAMIDQSGPVCSILVVNGLAAVIVKLDSQDIESFRGPCPVLYRYELGRYPTGAIIRLYLEIRDKPGSPYRMETFLNPGQGADLDLLTLLTEQAVLDLHFFDLGVEYIFSKRLRHRELNRRELTQLVAMAMDWLETIPQEQRDWQATKNRYQADVPL